MYQILPYTFNQAKRMGVLISPSEKPKYKIDVYTKSGEFVSSVGASGYSDYPRRREVKNMLIIADDYIKYVIKKIG